MDRNWRRIAWGIALVVIGVLMLDDRVRWLDGLGLDWRWWGLLVSLLGAAALIQPRRAGDVGNGVTFICLGAWFVLASTNAYGFNWSNSWPLALVSVGAGTVAHAIAAHWLPDRTRVRVRMSREEPHA